MGEEEKAKQAAAQRLKADEELKAQEAKDNKSKAAKMKMPETEHEIRLAQADAYNQAAALKTKEGKALQLAAQSKAKSNAMELMTTTWAAVKVLQEKVAAGNSALAADASVAQKDLKKALDAPFSKNALQTVEKGQSEVKQAKLNDGDLKLQLAAAVKSADAAKKAYFDGLASNFGQAPAPAKEEAPAKKEEALAKEEAKRFDITGRSLDNDDLPDKPNETP